MIYVCLHDFNILYESGVVQAPQLLLIEFSPKEPEKYQIWSYTVEPSNLFGWDVVCYRLGDSIFIAGESEIAAINLNTKKLRYCSEEHLKAQDFAKEKFGEELYHAFFFRAIFEWNGGTVYSAKISEAVDVPPIGMIYIACKDENIISYISVDLIQDKMEDGIEIKMVE